MVSDLSHILARELTPYAAVQIQGRKTAFALSVFNLMNAIMGSGMLSLPYILSKCAPACGCEPVTLEGQVWDSSICRVDAGDGSGGGLFHSLADYQCHYFGPAKL